MFCLISLLVAQSSVTLSFPPTPLPKALALLSKQTGIKLEAVPALRDEVLVARLNDADSNLVISRLAESLVAKWETQPDGTRLLKPDAVALRRLQAERVVKDIQILRGSLDYVRRRLAEQPEELDAAFAAKQKAKEKQEEEQRQKAMEAQDWSRAFKRSSTSEETPGWRATARLILLIPEKTLLSMQNNQREVWAENPTPMQHPFPPAAAPVIAKFRRELQAFEPETDVTRVRLRFVKWETNGAFNVFLEGLGQGGKILATGFVRMNNDNDLLKIPFDERNKVEPKPGEKPLKLDPEWVEARTFMSVVGTKTAQEHNLFLAKWKPRLVAPVEWEPTQWYEGADLMAAAEDVGKNLIGTVGDITGSRYDEMKELPTATKVLFRNRTRIRETSDGWLVLHLDEPRARGSRSKGEALLKDSVKRGGVSIDAAAAWTCSYADKWPMLGWIGDNLQALLPGALNTIIDDESLRMWGALTELQRLALRRGETIRLTNLTPTAKAQIHKMAFWFEGLGETIEPTDVLPNGIADGTVHLSITESAVFIAWASDGGDPDERFPLTTKSFGAYLAKGDTYREIPVERFRRMDRFKMGVRRTYKLLFALEPGSQPMEVELTETLFDPAAKLLEKLPAELAAEVEKSRQATLAKPATPEQGKVIPPR